ncbi:MAG: ATP-binding protein [Desulfobacteraceae bacterium]
MSQSPSRDQVLTEDGTPRFFALLKFVDVLPDPVLILDHDQRVVHATPALEKVLGWTRDEILHRPFSELIDASPKELSVLGQTMSKAGTVREMPAYCRTKGGRRLKVILDAVPLSDPRQEFSGTSVVLQGVSGERRAHRVRQILLRMSKALHRYRKLDRLLRYVTRLIQVLMQVGGASVIFVDHEKEEFYYHIAAYDDSAAGRRLTTIRFPIDKGLAGEVYRTGKPMIVSDYAQSPYAYKQVDEQAEYETRNMLDVPLRIKDRIIGVLCAVNKLDSEFDDEDVELLSVIADVVALPIENARVNEALRNSYERVKSLNQAKERVIIHLSHELKTPLSVLSASLKLLERRLATLQDTSWMEAFGRSQRSLERLLEMEYAVEDILKQKESASFDAMTALPRPTEQMPDPQESERFFQQVNIEFLIHELKAPLSVIETNTHMLNSCDPNGGISSERYHRITNRISRSTRRVRALLEELLEVGRAEAVCFNCRPFGLVPVIQQVLMEAMESHSAELYEKARSHKGINKQMAFLASNGIRFQAQEAAHDLQMVQDETKFRQVVANLLKNALTYRRNLLLIDLTCHKDSITLSVRDDGPGIATEHHEKIFERYTQVTPYPGVARSGHGLGLAVSRILARSMDGDITVESQLGQGAVFRLALPMAFDNG